MFHTCLSCICSLIFCCRKYFNENIQGMTDPLVQSTVEVYNSIRAELLPTPSKSHYTFNLRDLSKV